MEKEPLSIKLAPYLQQDSKWPQKGRHIMAQYDQQSIVLYQAFKPSIAEAIIKHQSYHHDECLQKGLSLTRMTWMKTSFLWMMYRSMWATKHNQERILAVRITLEGYEHILRQAYHAIMKTKGVPLKVRLQWDPDYQPNGERVNSGRRAIQLGIPGGLLTRISKQFIVKIQDITDEIVQPGRKSINSLKQLMTPLQKVYQINDKQLRQVIMNVDK